MRAVAEKIEKNKVKLTIELDNERFARALNRVYKRIANEIDIPGFRRGKAPKFLLDRYVGKEKIRYEAIEDIFSDVYREAVKMSNISPVSQPVIENIEDTSDKLVLELKVDVKPEVKLGQYKGIEVEKPSVEVSDEEIQKELEYLQRANANLVVVNDGELQDGDVAIIDFTGYIDGKPFDNGSAKNYSLTIGSGSFIAGFEDQLLGLKPGEEREIKVTFPKDYHIEMLAGKEASFNVKLNEIKRYELPPLDDEFAKEVSEFDTLEELKKDIFNKTREVKEQKVDSEVQRNLIKKVISNSEMEIPDSMIERQIDRMVEEMYHELRARGIELSDCLRKFNYTLEDIREKIRDEAEFIIKKGLVLDAITESENLKASDEEVDKEISEIAERLKQDLEKFKQTIAKEGDLDIIKLDISRRKVIDFLLDNAVIVKKDN
ncbi:trigger factor [Peptococcaceae bacterium]|nr:trigger factor [Peptococcaceae bacterium]